MPLSTFTILSQPLHGFFVLNTNLSIVDTQVASKVFNTPNIHGNHLTVFKAFRVFLSEDAHYKVDRFSGCIRYTVVEL